MKRLCLIFLIPAALSAADYGLKKGLTYCSILNKTKVSDLFAGVLCSSETKRSILLGLALRDSGGFMGYESNGARLDENSVEVANINPKNFVLLDSDQKEQESDRVLDVSSEKEAIQRMLEKDGITLYKVCELGLDQLIYIFFPIIDDINEAQEGGWTPLHVACKNGHIEVVKKLFTRKDLDANAVTQHGCTPLYVASQFGHEEIVKVLLNKGVDLHKAKTYGWTPLLVACEYGHTEVMRILLDAGARFSDLIEGKTALRIALDKKNEVAIHLLKKFLTQKVLHDKKGFKGEACAICLEDPACAKATGCCLNGVFCANCIVIVIAGSNPICPLCRAKLNKHMLIDVAQNEAIKQVNENAAGSSNGSSV